EEERRLFYVGITRARRKLYLTHAQRRRRAGEFLPCIPSSFLKPIPPQLVEMTCTREVERMRRYDEPTGWRRSSGGTGSAGWRDNRADSGGASAGVYIDYTDAQDAPRFVKGERIRHAEFGRGVIRELTGFGRDVKAVIDFEGIGRKKLVLRYANLQKEL
ncbi:MAG: 3'-5' exonuclease, partial [Longimicrobiales bacterium]